MEEQTEQKNNSVPKKASHKVLLVEDTLNLKDALERYLKVEGFEVMTALDGEEGFALAQDNVPDFILADIFMPRLGGIDMVKQIRATEWGRDIPVLLLSNFSLDKDSLESVKELGKLKYMTKADNPLKTVVDTVVEMISRYSQKPIVPSTS